MIVVSSTGIRGLEEAIRRFPEDAKQAAKFAVNDTIEWAKVHIKAGILAQIAVPDDSITPARFGISRRASISSLEARLSASNQGLGLIRFVTSPRFANAKSPTVRVKPRGREEELKRAFLIKTPGAKTASFALDVRAPGGLAKSRAARRIPGSDVYILSGPSPNQLLANIAPKLLPEIELRLNTQWARQYERLSRG
jgi:hypothetical protein